MSFLRTKSLKIGAALIFSAAAVAGYSTPAFAQEGQGSGEVRRVDTDRGRITIKHGAIPDLELPAMALVYKANPSLLAGIKPGDKVSFTAKRSDDGYEITAIKN